MLKSALPEQEIRVVIIEDEIASQQYLRQLLQQYFPGMQLLAVIDNVPEAIDAVKRLQPHIVFLDVEIKMGTGFDVLEALPRISFEVIFTTAFNQFAIDAFRYHAIDYLLKPLDDKRVVEAVSYAREHINQKSSAQQIARLLQHLHQPALTKKISIHTVDGIEFVDPDDILFAEAKGNYTEIRLRTGVKYIVSKKLKEMEQSLSEPVFFRIHYSYIVNAKYVKKYFKGRGGYVTLQDDTVIPVSAARKDDFLRHFGQE